MRELAAELGYPGLKEWGLPNWYNEMGPKPIPIDHIRGTAVGEEARAMEKEVDERF